MSAVYLTTVCTVMVTYATKFAMSNCIVKTLPMWMILDIIHIKLHYRYHISLINTPAWGNIIFIPKIQMFCS